MTKPSVRVRFAPSPTGFQHLGTIRSALFNWLFARHSGGTFILRNEDTDKAREVEGAFDYTSRVLDWLGMTPDEGPVQGGDFGPYSQSQRLQIYQDHARQLIDAGHAYADSLDPQQLQELRQQAQTEKRPFRFRDHRPENPPAWGLGQPLRFKSPDKAYSWDDAVRGRIDFGSEALDDIILIKSDGFPTYNFAHIVDDHLMQISHVLRADEFISSIPNYLAIYEAFGWQPPVNGILPPVLGKTGGKKLSKRDGAEEILEYQKRGFLPEAILNFEASLGWNDGSTQEVFSVNELIQKFSLERIQSSPARFDPERLEWLNGMHIRQMPVDELIKRSGDFWPVQSKDFDDAYKKRVLSLVHERLKFLAELPELTEFFFADPTAGEELRAHLNKISDAAESLLNEVTVWLDKTEFSEPELEKRLRQLAENSETKTGTLFGLIRVAITGRTAAPGLFETMATLGRKTTLRRLHTAIDSLLQPPN
jgi:glutamyl-tRNA synthetase